MTLLQTHSKTAPATPYRKLSELLPLITPLKLMIDPANACNFRCTFCPTGDYDLLESVDRPLGVMKYELYCKIIDDLKVFPEKLKSLRLYKDGEPFLNKNIAKMIRYAKERAVADEIYIITNGSLIGKKTAGEIIEAGLDRIRISVEHVSAEKYKAVTRNYEKYDVIISNARGLYEEKRKRNSALRVDVKIVDTGLSRRDLDKFKADFGPISDSLSIETLMGWSNSAEKDWTLGTNPQTGIDGQSTLEDVQVCPEPFKGLAVNFDGTVSVCCVDWSHGTLVGDLKKESFYDIWNGPKLRGFRVAHLRKQRHTIAACADCHYIKGQHPLSRLDGQAQSLLPKFNEGFAAGGARRF